MKTKVMLSIFLAIIGANLFAQEAKAVYTFTYGTEEWQLGTPKQTPEQDFLYALYNCGEALL